MSRLLSITVVAMLVSGVVLLAGGCGGSDQAVEDEYQGAIFFAEQGEAGGDASEPLHTDAELGATSDDAESAMLFVNQGEAPGDVPDPGDTNGDTGLVFDAAEDVDTAAAQFGISPDLGLVDTVSVSSLAAQAHRYSATAFYWPLRSIYETQAFGAYRKASNGYHQGWDLRGTAGTPVYATANGIVVYAGRCGTWGGLVIVEHKVGSAYVVSLYGHLRADTLKVKAGWAIGQGRLIGYLGNPKQNGGWAEHLHFEIRKGAYPGIHAFRGYGSSASLRQWHNPEQYIAAHLGVPYDPNPIPLWRNTSSNWFKLPARYYQKYVVSVPVNRTVNIRVGAIEGDPDLYVAYTSAVSPTKYSWRAVARGANLLKIRPSRSPLHVAVYADPSGGKVASWYVDASH